MAEIANIDSSDGWYKGEDQLLDFEILTSSFTPVDVTTWTFEWAIRVNKNDTGAAVLSKTTSAGITITGTYNADRDVNTQRVRVAIAASDTDNLESRRYFHALKRTTGGNEQIVSDGYADLLVAAVH
jgi:hypothetical protein